MDRCECWRCLRPEATYEDYLAHVREVVDRCGWLVQGVVDSGGRAPLASTVGLTEAGLPELLVTGRRLQVAASLLNAVAEYTLREVEVLPGEILHLGDVHLEAVELPHPDAHLLTATALYGGDQVRALQLVWADDRGRLPWERGHRGGQGGQPVLGPRTVEARSCRSPRC